MLASSDPALESCLGPLLYYYYMWREGKGREERVFREYFRHDRVWYQTFASHNRTVFTYLPTPPPLLYSIPKQKVSANQPPPLLHNDTQVQMWHPEKNNWTKLLNPVASIAVKPTVPRTPPRPPSLWKKEKNHLHINYF
jgi:hypothetical protein